MAKITASTFIQFGTTVNGASEVGQFGSYVSPTFSSDISVMQSGTAWPRGWFASVLDNSRQFIQDQNAVDCVFSNYLAYIQQMGIGEYVSTTVYDLNSIVQVAGQLYISLVAPNTGNTPVSSPTQWQSGIPGMEVTGVIKSYAGNVAPSGYLLCDGSAVSRSTYAALFNICSTVYGPGNGTTTFNIPDLRGHIPIGYKSGDADFGTLGVSGGAKTINLQHNHGANTGPNSGSPSAEGTGGSAAPVGHTHPINNDLSAAQTILNPFQVINYIIKT